MCLCTCSQKHYGIATWINIKGVLHAYKPWGYLQPRGQSLGRNFLLQHCIALANFIAKIFLTLDQFDWKHQRNVLAWPLTLELYFETAVTDLPSAYMRHTPLNIEGLICITYLGASLRCLISWFPGKLAYTTQLRLWNRIISYVHWPTLKGHCLLFPWF